MSERSRSRGPENADTSTMKVLSGAGTDEASRGGA
jgi:hypothetical protein